MSDYVRSIDNLIPIAKKEATRKVAILGKETEIRSGADGKSFNWDFWTEFFHAAMNRMAIEKGFRS